jgi:hypothetical protein
MQRVQGGGRELSAPVEFESDPTGRFDSYGCVADERTQLGLECLQLGFAELNSPALAQIVDDRLAGAHDFEPERGDFDPFPTPVGSVFVACDVAALKEGCDRLCRSVTYRPRTERQSHYLRARLADQFDALIHVDETRAVEPLERTARWEEGEVPETFAYAV